MADIDFATKLCGTCGVEKPSTAFNKASDSKDGLYYRCKQCRKEIESKSDPDRSMARARYDRWLSTNQEHLKEYQRSYYLANRKDRLEKADQFRKLNGDRIRKWLREYYALNKEKYDEYSAARRARKLGAAGTHTKKQVQLVYKNQRGKCACCKLPLNGKYHADHVIPLARGGSNDIGNIQVLCPPCNLSKKDRDPIDFMQSRGFLL